ncbi:MAG: OmpA family protein [Sphingobacteriales bacterium]|nr:MAG: OmpA family protein [Sphingobacteriales bacterium]
MKKTLLIPAALLALTFTACRDTTPSEEAAHSDNTAVLVPNGDPTAGDLVDSAGNKIDRASTAVKDEWNDVDWNTPVSKDYTEVTDKDIEVRGTERYGIYNVGENVLFATGSASLTSGAKAKIKSIAGSINQRYKDADVRIAGFTDAVGGAGANQELSKQRADAVRAELMANGLNADKVTVNAMGESQAAGGANQADRKVQIVARKA